MRAPLSWHVTLDNRTRKAMLIMSDAMTHNLSTTTMITRHDAHVARFHMCNVARIARIRGDEQQVIRLPKQSPLLRKRFFGGPDATAGRARAPGIPSFKIFLMGSDSS
jgi:hypothetical protein